MDLTYLIVAVFGMCVLRPCRSLPTTAAAAAVAPAPTPSEPSLRVAVEPADSGSKRSRSLFQSPPPLRYNRFPGHGAVHPYDDDAVMDDLPLYVQQRRGPEDEEDEQENAVDQDVRLSSRARPAKPDSPIYFIRMPPQPYMYVPGYGYVSQPTRLEPPPFTQPPHSPFLNLPLSYVSNAKPVGIYTLPQQHQNDQQHNQYNHHQVQQQHHQQHLHQHQQPLTRPKPNRRPPQPVPSTPAPRPQHQPDSPIYNLDKGPYVFNGRPSDVFLLQSAYDNLYSEVLQNIYP